MGPTPRRHYITSGWIIDLVGKQILHKFKYEGDEKWFRGCVLSYDEINEEHKITYNNEEKDCYFNLMDDMIYHKMT